MRQVVVGLMSGQGQGGRAERLQGGGACSGTPVAVKTSHTQDMPTPTVFVSVCSVQSPVSQGAYTVLCLRSL